MANRAWRSIPLICVTMLFMAASLTFVLFFATALVIDHSHYAGLAIAAAFAEVIDLIFLAHALFRHTGLEKSQRWIRRSQIRRLWLAVALISHVLPVALLASLQAEKQKPTTIFRSNWTRFLYTTWTLVAISTLLHIIYLIQDWNSVSGNNVDTSNLSSAQVLDASRKHSEPMALHPPSQSHGVYELQEIQTQLADSPTSTAAHDRIGPSSSITRLVQPRPTSESSADRSQRNSIESGMSTMVSSRSPSLRHEPFYGRPSTPPQQRLEPIPGSASNSPGRALDMADPVTKIYRHRGRRSSRASLDSLTDESRVPPRFRKNSTTRPSSPVVISESYIHPLFRSDSPLPPPTPTVSTTVTASAYGGRTLSKEDLARAQSRSRPASPAHHLSSTPRSRQNSLSRTSPRMSTDTGSPIPSRARSMENMHGKSWLSSADEPVPPLPSTRLLPSSMQS